MLERSLPEVVRGRDNPGRDADLVKDTQEALAHARGCEEQAKRLLTAATKQRLALEGLTRRWYSFKAFVFSTTTATTTS